MEPHFLPAMSWFITFITMIFIYGSKLAFAQDDEQYVNCRNSFNCGNIEDISYPFWGSNRPEYCGYPGFKLDCSNQDLELTFMQSTYKVFNIDKQSRTLNVTRKDYTENICPTLLFNTTLNPDHLNYTSDDHNITIYYGCPTQAPPTTPIPVLSTQFPCNINQTDITGYFTAANLSSIGSLAPSLVGYLTSCKNSIKIPVRQSALGQIVDNNNPTDAQLLGALNEGFGLEWNAEDNLCETCKVSGGQCGYNLKNTPVFTCYCKDGPREFSCQASSTNDPRTNDAAF